jgi:hypothetical protein
VARRSTPAPQAQDLVDVRLAASTVVAPSTRRAFGPSLRVAG